MKFVSDNLKALYSLKDQNKMDFYMVSSFLNIVWFLNENVFLWDNKINLLSIFLGEIILKLFLFIRLLSPLFKFFLEKLLILLILKVF